jgi:hypothetical protein
MLSIPINREEENVVQLVGDVNGAEAILKPDNVLYYASTPVLTAADVWIDFTGELSSQASGEIFKLLEIDDMPMWASYLHKRLPRKLTLYAAKQASVLGSAYVALESYVAWGKRQKKLTILAYGMESDDGLALGFLIFKDYALINVKESGVGHRHHVMFQELLSEAISSVYNEYRDAELVSAWPLDIVLPRATRSLTADDLLAKITPRLIGKQPIDHAKSFAVTYGIPAVAVAISVVYLASATLIGISNFTSAKEDFESVMQTDEVISKIGGIDVEYLKTLNARKLYLEKNESKNIIADDVVKAISAVGMLPEVVVKHVKISEKKGVPARVEPTAVLSPVQSNQVVSKPTMLVDILLEVPKDDTLTTVEQGDKIINILAQASGAKFYLAFGGYRDSDTGSRSYAINGEIDHSVH